jgi:hypothetical protein
VDTGSREENALNPTKFSFHRPKQKTPRLAPGRFGIWIEKEGLKALNLS